MAKQSRPWLASAAEEGNWHEARMKAEMRELGCEIWDEQLELTLNQPEFNLVGHWDGRIHVSGQLLDKWKTVFLDLKRSEVDFSQPMLLECKSFSYLEHQRWEQGRFDAFPQYASQITCYGQASGLKLTAYATKDRSGGARTLYITRTAQDSIETILARLGVVAKYYAMGQVAPGNWDSSSIECRRCEFEKQLCAPELIAVDDEELFKVAQNYIEGRALEKEGKALAEEARDILVGYAQARELPSFKLQDLEIQYSTYPRSSISIKGLEAIMPREQFAEAIKTVIIERLRVIKRGEIDG